MEKLDELVAIDAFVKVLDKLHPSLLANSGYRSDAPLRVSFGVDPECMMAPTVLVRRDGFRGSA